MQKQKIWLGLCKEKFGLVETNFIPAILPSQLFRLQQMLRPTLNIKNDIEFDKPLKIVVVGDGKVKLNMTRSIRSNLRPEAHFQTLMT